MNKKPMSEQMCRDDQQELTHKRLVWVIKGHYDHWIVMRMKDVVGCNRQDIDHDMLGKQLQAIGC